MDIFWLILGGLFILAGIIGCIVPLLPGPPLSYIGFLVLQLKSDPPFSTQFLLSWAVVVIVVTLLDYFVPAYGTKKLGGSKYGIWGCTLGLFIGIWMGPLGIILGPFLGALAGELIGNKSSNQAFKSAVGSFVGFLFSTLLKLITCFVMAWYFIKAV